MEIDVKGCIDCPFSQLEWDDFAMGDQFVEKCGLAHYLNKKETFIQSYSNMDKAGTVTPKWCPLNDVEETKVKKL